MPALRAPKEFTACPLRVCRAMVPFILLALFQVTALGSNESTALLTPVDVVEGDSRLTARRRRRSTQRLPTMPEFATSPPRHTPIRAIFVEYGATRRQLQDRLDDPPDQENATVLDERPKEHVEDDKKLQKFFDGLVPGNETARIVIRGLKNVPVAGGHHLTASHTLEIGVGVAIMIVLGAAIIRQVMPHPGAVAQDESCLDSSTAITSGLGEDSQVIGDLKRSNSIPHCDYCMIFPLRGGESSNLHVSGSQFTLIHWDDKVDGLELAHLAFMDPNKARAVSEEEILKRFRAEMTAEQYNEEASRLLVDILAGPLFGAEVEAFPSIDHDEAILKIYLPEGHDTVAQYAAHFGYRMPMSDHAYDLAKMQPPKDIYGVPCRAWNVFDPDKPEFFMPFRVADRLRLLNARLHRYIDIEQLVTQNVVVEHYVAHEYKTIEEFCQSWANPKYWYHTGEPGIEDRLRDYFGEEVAWMFVWQQFYMNWLFVPAIAGGVVFLRRYFLCVTRQRDLQLAFAVFMSLWATIFNCMYMRHEARLRQRWGMDRFRSPWRLRDEYSKENDRSMHVTGVKVLGDVLALLMLVLTHVGQNRIHAFTNWLSYSMGTKFALRSAAIMTSVQIMVLDMVWREASRRIVDLENHKGRVQWHNSFVQRVFLVRMFNNLYPFIYVGFLKRCGDVEEGCLGELERNLLCYFILRIVTQFLSYAVFQVLSKTMIFYELNHSARQDRRHVFLQLQAKAQAYDDLLRLQDWTEQVLTFLFLICFSVVLPSIAVLALLTTMVEGRLLALRNCCVLRRPVPVGAFGIGVWHNVLEVAECLAVVINVMFGVFTMHPLDETSIRMRFTCFVIAEHAVFLVKLLLKLKFPSIPPDVEDMEAEHEDMLRKCFIDRTSHQISLHSTSDHPDVGPRAFGGRRSEEEVVGGRDASDAGDSLPRSAGVTFSEITRPSRRGS